MTQRYAGNGDVLKSIYFDVSELLSEHCWLRDLTPAEYVAYLLYDLDYPVIIPPWEHSSPMATVQRKLGCDEDVYLRQRSEAYSFFHQHLQNAGYKGEELLASTVSKNVALVSYLTDEKLVFNRQAFKW